MEPDLVTPALPTYSGSVALSMLNAWGKEAFAADSTIQISSALKRDPFEHGMYISWSRRASIKLRMPYKLVPLTLTLTCDYWHFRPAAVTNILLAHLQLPAIQKFGCRFSWRAYLIKWVKAQKAQRLTCDLCLTNLTNARLALIGLFLPIVQGWLVFIGQIIHLNFNFFLMGYQQVVGT